MILTIILLLITTTSYSKEYKAYVHRIIDGDTIECTLDLGFGVSIRDKVRFLDYDAPEIFRPGSEAERELGLEAKRYLQRTILKKDIILDVPPKKERGKYGRILGSVYLNGLDIIKIMKEKGYIKISIDRSNKK